jgi:hypothetical protein
MFGIRAKITKCIDDTGYPSFVECQFIDAHGNIQIFNDKDAIFTTESLDRHSIYPKVGVIGCEIIKRKNSVIKVDTKIPWHIESISGETIFDVEATQIIEFDHKIEEDWTKIIQSSSN